MKKTIIGIAALAGVLCAGSIAAQNYPTKPIRFLVGYAPGGGWHTDPGACGWCREC